MSITSGLELRELMNLIFRFVMGFIGFALVACGSDVVPRFYWHSAQVHAEGCSGLPCETSEKERAA